MENNEEQKIYTIYDKVDKNGDCLLIKRDQWGEGNQSSPHVKKYTLDLGKDYDKFSIEYIAENQRWISYMDYHSAPDYAESERSSIAMKINDKKLAQALGLEKKAILQSDMQEGVYIYSPSVGTLFNIVMRYMFALDYFMSTAHKTIYGIDTPKNFRNYSNPVGDKIYNEIITAFRNKIQSFFSKEGFKNIKNTEDAQQFLDNQFKEHNLAGPLYTINQVEESIVGPYLERMQEKNKRRENLDKIITWSMRSKDDQKSFLTNVLATLAAKLKSYHDYTLVRREVMERLKKQGIKMRRSEVQEAVQKAVQEAARKADDLERNN